MAKGVHTCIGDVNTLIDGLGHIEEMIYKGLVLFFQ